MAAPPELMDELVEEILLRLPLDQPAHLARAALVCRRWRRRVSGPGFRRRLRAFHRTPPMLGFLCNLEKSYMAHFARFVPTTTSSCSLRAGEHPWRADDARHGHILLSRRKSNHLVLMVWDPITDHRQELPVLPWPLYSYKAAVLCASAAACDHLDCHRGGPFLVVYIGIGRDGAFSCIYSSDAAAWSKPVSINLPRVRCINLVQSVLVGNALYFMFHKNDEALEYDLELCRVVSLIKLPPYSNSRRVVLTTTEDGGLGYATAIEHKLFLWARKDGSKGDAGCIRTRVINLDGLLRISDRTMFAYVIGYADGVDVIFFRMGDVLYTIDLKTRKVEEVYKGGTHVYGIVPYMGFCIPALEPVQARDQAVKHRCHRYMKEET